MASDANRHPVNDPRRRSPVPFLGHCSSVRGRSQPLKRSLFSTDTLHAATGEGRSPWPVLT
ncbi:MAG: hypothetical protein AAF609_26060 [Cyanobacteria bacterium P01_C01_bin.120]